MISLQLNLLLLYSLYSGSSSINLQFCTCHNKQQRKWYEGRVHFYIHIVCIVYVCVNRFESNLDCKGWCKLITELCKQLSLYWAWVYHHNKNQSFLTDIPSSLQLATSANTTTYICIDMKMYFQSQNTFLQIWYTYCEITSSHGRILISVDQFMEM